MKKIRFLFLALALTLLLTVGSALAAGPENPRRPSLPDFKELRRLTPRGDITATITMQSAPVLLADGGCQPGSFSVTLSGEGADSMQVVFAIQDSREDVSTVYWGVPSDSRSFETCDLYYPGSYTLFALVYDTAGNQVSYDWCDFTVAPVSGRPTLEEDISRLATACAGSTDWETALNIHDWLTHNAYYDLDYLYYGPDIIARGKGVCDSYSKAFRLLCNAAGIPCERVIGSTHAWNAIQLGGKWYLVDVTWDDPTSASREENDRAVSGHERYDYFCLNRELMDADHAKYQASYTREYTAMEANYDVHEGAWMKYGTRLKDDYTGTVSRLENVQAWLETAQKMLTAGKYLYDMGSWNSYITNYTGYSYSSMPFDPDRALKIYAYGMNALDWSIPDGGPVRINAQYSSATQGITVEFLGWDVEERALILPADLLTIEDSAFENTDATYVYLPDGLQEIGSNAFAHSAVRTVRMPAGIHTLSGSAFDSCGRIILIADLTPDLCQYAQEHNFMLLQAP